MIWLLLLAACAREPSELSPESVLHDFLHAMERSEHDPEARREAFELLDRQSRAALQERASLARTLSGRALEPWELLVPGLMRVSAAKLRPESLEARIQGDRAEVSIPIRSGDPAKVPLRREDGRWLVVLALGEPASSTSSAP